MTILGLVVWPLAPSVVPGVVLLLTLLVGVLVWARKSNSGS